MTFYGEVYARLKTLNIDYELITIVLPDQNAIPAFKEAGLKYAVDAETPIVMPKVVTLHRLCQEVATLRIPRRLSLLVELHEALTEVMGGRAFEQAKPLLEIMLNDFDELDSQLLNSESVFQSLINESSLKVAFSDYITDDEKEVIKQYWANFSDEKLKTHDANQLHLYQHLPQIYTNYQNRLRTNKIIYRGGLYKKAYEALCEDEKLLTEQYFVFVGFNKLSESQIRIMETLVERRQAHVWHDNLPYTNHTEESTYFQRKLTQRSKLKLAQLEDAHIESTTHTALKGAGQQVGLQAIVAEIKQIVNATPLAKIAILAPDGRDSAYLSSVLTEVGISCHNLHPQSLVGTPLFSLLQILSKLYQKGITDVAKHQDIPLAWLRPLVQHPLYKQLFTAEIDALGCEKVLKNHLRLTIEQVKSWPLLDAFYAIEASASGFWSALVTQLNNLASEKAPMLKPTLQAALQTLVALEDQLGERLPTDLIRFWQLYAGELATTFLPLQLSQESQVTLATLADVQGQDFDVVFFTHATEGNLPTALPRSTLIPLLLRAAWGMSTPKEDAAQQAYLFYRLLKRTQKVFYYINEATDDLAFAEPSRYLLQLRDVLGHTVSWKQVSLSARVTKPETISIPKDEAIYKKLQIFLTKDPSQTSGPSIYPTHLARYIKCPLQYYLTDIAKLKEEDTLTEEMDGSRFGNILHNSMEEIYKPLFTQKAVVSSAEISRLQAHVATIVRNKTLDEYGFSTDAQLEELAFIAAAEQVVVTIIHKLLERDKSRVPFSILKLEGGLSHPYLFPIEINGGKQFIRLDGKFDRVDQLRDGTVEIIDYKTGSRVETAIPNAEALFSYRATKDYKEAFQILTYAWLLQKTEGYPSVRPTVIRIGDLFSESKTSMEAASFIFNKEVLSNIYTLDDIMHKSITQMLQEILNPDIPFVQTSNHNACKFCSFVTVCQRA